MKITIQVDLAPTTGQTDDADRVADIAAYQLLDGKTVTAGAESDAPYLVTGWEVIDTTD